MFQFDHTSPFGLTPYGHPSPSVRTEAFVKLKLMIMRNPLVFQLCLQHDNLMMGYLHLNRVISRNLNVATPRGLFYHLRTAVKQAQIKQIKTKSDRKSSNFRF